MKENAIHNGHRTRLKSRFLQEGLDHFNEINVLELLLFYCVPKQDTNPLAHRLLDEFGSFEKVLEASPGELKKVPGVGEHIATFFPLLMEVNRYYEVKKNEKYDEMKHIEDYGKYLLPRFINRKNETVFLLCIDAKCKVLSCEMVGEGSVNSAGVPIRRIVEMALKVGACTAVLAHNHPSGVAIPSEDDIHTTRQLAHALRAVDIILLDHIVVADNDYVSLYDSHLYNPNDTSFIP